jgi:hypothetical protein
MEPMSAATDFDLEASRRVPLADAVLRLLQYAIDKDFLGELFERERGSCFERDLPFDVFVNLIADALLGHQGSAHQTFRQARKDETLPTTVKSVYERLATIPCRIGASLLAQATRRLNRVGVCVVDPLFRSVAGYRVLAMDGKKLKYVAKRLQQLRGLKGNVLGGKLLVAQDMATGQAIAVEAAIDGEAADNPLVAGLVAQVRAFAQADDADELDRRPRLWVADRGFCDYKIPHVLSEDGDAFLIREHGKCKFHCDSTVPQRTGTDTMGRPFREELGWLGAANNPQRVRVRRIVVERPSGGPLVLVTNLLDADRYPAIDLLLLYGKRWGIETVFQRVVQTYDLRHLIGGKPQATVFQACFCLLLYNIALVVLDYVAEGGAVSRESVSVHLLHEETVRQLTAWMKIIGPNATADVLSALPMAGADALRDHLRRTLKGVWNETLRKAKTTKRPPKQAPRAYLKGGHSSVDRILRGVHQEIPIKPRKPTKSS